MDEKRLNWFDPQRFETLRQIDNETAKAHQAFLDYVRMGAGRSIARLFVSYEQRWKNGEATAEKPPTKTKRTLEKWSSTYNWQARLAAYREQCLVFEQVLWEQRRFEQKEREWTLANKLAASAEKMADWPIQKATVTEYYADGRPKIVIFEPVAWTKGDAARFAKTSSELGRAAAAMVQATTETRVTGQIVTLTADDLAQAREEAQQREQDILNGTSEDADDD